MENSIEESLESRYLALKQRIAGAAAACGRSLEDITLVAVSKGHDSNTIRAAYDLGQRDFGESYIQEWLTKRDALMDLTEIRWHFIGHLQSNKAKLLAEGCYCIQSIDRSTIAEILERRFTLAPKRGTTPLRALIQLQVDASDGNKFGLKAKEAERVCEIMTHMKEIEWSGFMGVGPAEKDPMELKALFDSFVAQCNHLWSTFHHNSGSSAQPVVSLGMTNDLEIAIASGSNMVRVGTSLFGERAPKPEEI
jgi:pyridoxal phosphate enzyme (YggS family)